MYTPVGFIEKRSPNRLPDAPLNREHPLDGSLNHREGRVATKADRARNAKVAVEGGTMVTRKGESIKAVRHTVAPSRSKLAKASATGHTQVFVKTQRDTDFRLDNPDHSTMVLTPARNGRTRGMGGRSGGGLRRSVA